MPDAETQRGTNAIVGADLREFIARIERLEEGKSQFIDDIKLVYAEAKARGYTPKHLRNVIKERRKSPSERDDDRAMRDLYETAAGLASELPLFRAVGQIDVDRTAQASVIEALKLLVPDSGEITIKMGGRPVRLWRDKDGVAHSEEVPDAPPPPRASGLPAAKPKADVPDCSADEAEALGRTAAREDQAIIANPFPWDDPRRARWDSGWRQQNGGDGMGPDA